MDHTTTMHPPISLECSTDVRHYACRSAGGAWEPVLDHAVDCGCWCHHAKMQLSTACGRPDDHASCGQVDAAWDALLDQPGPCRCGCHPRRG